jgi:raffinose/stachyose/melibiose transport system substrate-binding protein
MKKLILSVILLSLVLLPLVGCSKTPDTSKETAKNETANTPSDSPKQADEQVTLSVSMHVANVADQEPAMFGMLKKFQELYPNIKIDVTGADTNEHVKQMKLRAQSNTLPDIFWMLPAPAKEMSQSGLLLDLSEFLNNNPDVATGIGSKLVDGYKDSGKQFGLPYQTLVTGLWYNKAIFDQFKVKVPETYDELVTATKVFKANNMITIAKGGKDNFSTWAFLGMLTRYGYFDKIDKILNKEEKFNNPDFVNLFKKMDELRTLGAFPTNVTTLGYIQAVDVFLQGKAAMLDAGAWETKKIEQSPIGKNVGFSWGPTFTDGVGNQKISMVVGAAPLVASAKVKDNPAKYDAVQKFFKFYYSQEGTEVMIQNELPPVVKYEGTVDKTKFPVFANLVEQMSLPGWEKPIAQPDLVVSDAIANAMNDGIYGVINGIYSPEQALDSIDKKVSQQK